MALARRVLAVVLSTLVLLLVLSSARSLSVGGQTAVAANPTGTTPLVYVAGSFDDFDDQTHVDAFPFSSIASGPSSIAPTQSVGIGQPIGVTRLAITRDAGRAVVIANAASSGSFQGSLFTIDTRTGVRSSAIVVEPSEKDDPLDAVATDPADGSLAYVVNEIGQLYEVDIDSASVTQITSLSVSSPITLLRLEAWSLAVSSDGETAYVAATGIEPNGGEVEAIFSVPLAAPDLPVGVWREKQEGDGIRSLALTPDGKEIFGCDGAQVVGLSLPLTTGESPFLTVAMPGAYSVTVGPHGRNVYVGVTLATVTDDGVTFYTAEVEGFAIKAPAHITTDLLQTAADPQAAGYPGPVAVMPDGHTLLAGVTLLSATGAPVPYLFTVSLGNLTASGGPAMAVEAAISLPGALTEPGAIAITPDQAPHATFTATLAHAGSPSSFDASASTVQYGSITSFTWDFGDGSPTETTAGDTVTHVFATAGTFTVTVVETDSAGTSIPPGFAGTPVSWAADGPGQTPYRLASPLAEHRESVTIVSTKKPVIKPGKAPFLALDPAVGPPGSVVTVTGSHFPNGAKVTIEWSTPNASATSQVVKVKNGGFTVQLLILVPDLLGPRQVIAVKFSKANRPTFLVVADSEEPGGANALPVFRSEGP